MYLITVATDYDGTLAHHGRVDKPTIAALERLKASGRKLIMVTGRELLDLTRIFDRFDLFDVVVAENGSLLYFPETEEERLVAAAPPPELVAALRNRGVEPLSIGGGIIAAGNIVIAPMMSRIMATRSRIMAMVAHGIIAQGSTCRSVWESTDALENL